MVVNFKKWNNDKVWNFLLKVVFLSSIYVNCIISDNFHLSVILLIFHHIFTKKKYFTYRFNIRYFFSQTSFSNITIPFKNLGEDQNLLYLFHCKYLFDWHIFFLFCRVKFSREQVHYNKIYMTRLSKVLKDPRQ